VFSDASAFGWGVLVVDPTGPFRIPPKVAVDLVSGTARDTRGWSKTGLFSTVECSLSSAAREIRAILYGVQALDLRRKRLLWHSDSTCATAAITKWGSSAMGVADALDELWNELRRREIVIEITHVKRDLSLMPVADWLSRQGWRDRQAEWAFATQDVRAVTSELRTVCDADLFSSTRNRQFPVFCSRFLEPGSRGDAFATPWWGHVWWAFPPISLRGRILHRLSAYLKSAKASVTAVGSSSRHHRRVLVIVLVMPPVLASDPEAELWRELQSETVLRTVTLWAPSSTPSKLFLPRIRLLDDRGRPAPRPPPWPLQAHLIRIADVQ
jgi:hypothetical protein